MKKLAGLCLCVLAGSANATVISGFTDDYAVDNWAQTFDGGGLIDTTDSPLSVILTSSNDGTGADNTDFTITASDDGTVGFDWLYSTLDSGGSSFDTFGWLLNGIFTEVSVIELFTDQSGYESFSVEAGDVFGFRTYSVDSILGAASTTVSNFSFTSVPEPASLALLGLGLAGIGLSRKKKSIALSAE